MQIYKITLVGTNTAFQLNYVVIFQRANLLLLFYQFRRQFFRLEMTLNSLSDFLEMPDLTLQHLKELVDNQRVLEQLMYCHHEVSSGEIPNN